MAARWTIVDLVVIVLGALGGSMAGGVLATLLTEDANLVLLSSFGGQFVGTLGVLWLIARSRGLGAESLGFEIEPADVLYIGLGVALQIAIALVFVPLQEILVPDGGPSQEVTEIFGGLEGSVPRLAMIAVSTLLAPLGEELMFRGVLLRSLQSRSRVTVMVVTSVVFAAFHLTGVSSVGAGLLVFTQIFLIGLVLAHVTLRTDRLGPAIFIHSGFNLLAALILLLPPEVLEQLGQAPDAVIRLPLSVLGW